MNDPSPVRFGAFELDLGTGELRKHGIRLKLQDQPFQVLQALVERPGELVTREELRARIWGDNTFVDFDQSLNRAVNKVREALGDSAENPRYIETMARRGYRFIAPVEAPPPESGPALEPPAPAPKPRRRLVVWVAAMGAFSVLLAGIWLAWPHRAAPLLEPVPLTTYDGLERDPSFSPDASQVAFSWDGQKQDNFDIYVKVVGTGAPLRLTTDPAPDRFPAWSPDGRFLAFLREGQGVYLVPPIGGTERKILDWPGIASPLSWSPDGRHLAFARASVGAEPPGIFVIPAQGGQTQRLTTADAPGFDNAPAFSPDGRWLAFASCRAQVLCGLAAVEFDKGLISRGRRPQRLTEKRGFIHTVAWTPDSQAVVYSHAPLPPWSSRLWKVTLARRAEPQMLGFAELGSLYPAVSRSGLRLAYSHFHQDVDIWSLANGVVAKSPLSSTVIDHNPQFSPDGSRVAFTSARSGKPEVWVAHADGSHAEQLTASLVSGSPRWSPDGRRIVYDTQQEDGNWDIRTINTAGGQPTPIASHPASDKVPSFSRDGKWIYFSSDRGGTDEIYRVPAAGGEPVRMTGQGGYRALESADGKSIYYTKEEMECGPLFVRSLEGGPERQVVDSVCMRNFEVAGQGIFYIGGSKEGRHFAIQVLDPATGKSSVVGRTDGHLYLGVGLAVSPNAGTILFSAATQTGADLMLVENFR